MNGKRAGVWVFVWTAGILTGILVVAAVWMFHERPVRSTYKNAVRAWLQANTNDGTWEEVRWWEPKTMDGKWLCRVKVRTKNALGATVLVDLLFELKDGRAEQASQPSMYRDKLLLFPD